MDNYGLKNGVIEAIIHLAETCQIQKLILFGSRARGDFKARSDIDLAVFGGNTVRFTLDLEEEIPTLLMFDVVNLEGRVQKELLDAIGREGVVLYEKI